MSKWKKVLSALLSAVMIASLAAGCGSSTASQETTQTATAAAQVSASASAESEAAVSESAEPTGTLSDLAQETFGETQPAQWSLPLDDGTNTLTLAVTFAADKLGTYFPNGTSDFEIYQEAEKRTGVHVDIQSLSTSASSEQFPIMIASGDYPDMIGWGLNYNGGNEQAVVDGVYLDLRDVIAKYAPNYYNILTSDDDLLSTALTESGYITNFAAITTKDGLGSFGPAIRTDLLEKLGLEKPYTVEDYENVLTAFKNDGVAEPLVLLSSGCAVSNYISGAYGVAAYQSTFPMTVAPFYVEDGKIKFGFTESGYLDYLSLIQDWLAKGLVSKNFYTENANWNSADYSNKIATGQAGIFYTDKGNLAGYNSASEIEGFQVEATYDAHLTEDSVNHFASFSKKSAANGICITNLCQNVQLAAEWCDWWYTDDASLLANYGIEGVSYEMVDGKPEFTDLVTESPLGTRDALMAYASNNMVMCVIDPEAMDSLYEQVDVDAPEIWAKGCDDANVIPQTVTLNQTENETYNAVYPDIATYCEENITKFITGDQPMSQWDSFVQGLWDMNLQKCIDVYQEAYDRAMAK